MLAGDGCVGPQGIANEVGMSRTYRPPLGVITLLGGEP